MEISFISKKWIKFVTEEEDYWRMLINKKKYLNHRLICVAFKEGFTYNSELVCDHINHDIHDNSVENLRCITRQQNQFNRLNVKGYRKGSNFKKDGTEVIFWRIQIGINGKQITKSVATRELAHYGYLELKRIHHII